MGDDRKKKGSSKTGLLIVVVLAAVAGAGVLGYMRPDTPVIGPLVASIFKQAAEVGRGEGVYSVKVSELRFADAEFKEGEKLDLQVVIYRLDEKGEPVKPAVFDTASYGERLAEAGNKEKPPVARWPDNPVTIDWKKGQEFLIEVWDKAGGDTKLVEWRTEKSTGFPLSGQITFKEIDRHEARDPKGNYVKFDASPTSSK